MFITREQLNKGIRIFAKDRYVSDDTRDSGLNNNDAIIGCSGSGKTGGYVIPNIKRHNGSMVVADTKGNLCRKLAGDLINSGYVVKTLDFTNPYVSVSYNPLDYIGYDSRREKYCQKDIISLARAIVPPVTVNDPFWDDAARTVVTFLIAFTLEALEERDHNMMSVLELFKLLCDEPSRKVFDEWLIEKPESFSAQKYRMFRGILSVDKTWGCITQFVTEALEMYDFDEIKPMFSGQNAPFNIRELGMRKTALFINISDTDRSMDRLVNLFYMQALQQLCSMADESPDSCLKVPVRFILDDFATNAYIADFDKIISVIRSRKISVSIILQSLTQLETMYTKAQASTIINNCDHLLYLGGQDITTAEYIGTRAGKTPDKVLEMGSDKAYLITKGEKGELVDKIPPYSDPLALIPIFGSEEQADTELSDDFYSFF